VIKAQEPGRSRWIRRGLVGIILLPVLLLGLANLIFATGLGTGLVEREIEKRLSLSCDIARISWSPWAGAQVSSLIVSTASGEPELQLARVDEVKIDPSWTSMLAGQRRFEKVEVKGVEIDLALESLKPFFKKDAVKAPQPPEPPEPEAPAVVKSKPTGSTSPTVKGKESKPPAPAAVPKAPAKPEFVPVDDFTGEITFSDVSVRIFSQALPEFEVAFDNFSAEVPLWGATREGQLKFEGLHIGEDGTHEDLILPIRWKENFLRVADPKLHLLGLHVDIDAALSLSSGVPFGIRLKVPEQQINFTSLRKNAPPVDIARFSSDNYLQGSLLYPLLMQGSSSTVIKDCVIRDPSDGSELRFSRGQSLVNLSSAGLVMRDFRLLGDEEAFLGNGFLSASGEGAATLRVIGNPQRAETFEKRVTQADPSWELGLTPLVTPDRWHRDLRLELGPHGATIDLGREKKRVLLREVVHRIRSGYQNSPLLTVP